MTEQIRFSQHVINCLDGGNFRHRRDSYGGRRIGFYQENPDADDFWELWAWKDWPFPKLHIDLQRRGKYLEHLTKDEKKALWDAMERAKVKALEREARHNERKRRQREADHWWP